ncbi:LacI family DNA-binding transcriptional regulator [Brachybacterium sp. MASK1Z-5]|uniref:LacI family DNA-binding transcriptional regulator n=1 Tax=Brachybacterium halotolerans TaxID=2795215 RepID=A0ABS1B6Y2_9MICO|nr:LacI family DNA-binding transcriptional regulator [Brachybacterium halotolerans]MBK0330414.1 LacI family DNA-binding transcriptional regulator [Brachybacterium halotolerans]
MKDVAARAGVSQQTVSLVLRGEAGPSSASREKVLEAAASLRYRRNASARLLRQRRSRLIGVLYAAANTFELQVVERILEVTAEQGFDVVLGPVSELRTTEVVVTELLEHRVEALACYNPDPHSPALRSAIAAMPVVWLGERAPDLGADGGLLDAVRTDEATGLRLLVEHLHGLGHTEIAYAGGAGGRVGTDRADAYREAMHAAGLDAQIDVLGVGFGEEDGALAVRTLLARERLPTAVIGCSDHCGAGMLGALVRAGLRIPEDVSLTGYDDSSVAALSYVDLTSVHQDVDRTARATLAAIERRLEHPEAPAEDQATLAELAVRSSTGPAPSR